MNLEILINILLSVVLLCIVIFGIYVFFFHNKKRTPKHVDDHKFSKHTANPIMSPRPHVEWEENGTFNPATIIDEKNKVHILYRAIGADGISRIGYASSNNGTKIDERSSFPIYHPEPGCGLPDEHPTDIGDLKQPQEFNTTVYTSGGGWGGSEDPRAILVDGVVYMTYTAFEGWDSVRIAITSIKLTDLQEKKWNWKKPQIISPKTQVNKNWVIFPEKINGKFAIIHSIAPEVKIDFADSLENFRLADGSRTISSVYSNKGRSEHWDNFMRGAGAPPIKTELGWLLLYHAMDKKDPNKYKIGAMILDINDPTKILYRSPKAIMEPEYHYENDGKPGVVYVSGAIIRNNDLHVYYGGGDRHVCVAKTPIDELLTWMKTHGKVPVTKKLIKKI